MWNLYVGHVANKSAGTLWYYYGLKANRGFDTLKGVTNKASGECTICHIERGVFGKLDIEYLYLGLNIWCIMQKKTHRKLRHCIDKYSIQNRQ